MHRLQVLCNQVVPIPVPADAGFTLSKLPNGCIHLNLNNPSRLNALTIDMFSVFRCLLKRWKTDPSVKFVVWTSSCPKSFSAGNVLLEISFCMYCITFNHFKNTFQAGISKI